MKPKDTREVSALEEILNQKETGCGPHPLQPLDHLAFAILIDAGYDVAEGLDALHRLRREFVDWNEVRVARVQEIVRVLGQGENGERSALRIKEDYNAFFENKGTLNFEFLAAGKPAEMRRTLAQLLPHLGKGAVSLLLYEFCPGASLPLSDEGVKKARKDGAIGKNGDRGQLARILTEHLELSRVCLLLQYWEIEALGNPYGEMRRKESGGVKKTRKTAEKAKPASKSV